MEITLCVLQDIIPFGAAALRQITEKYKYKAGQGLLLAPDRLLMSIPYFLNCISLHLPRILSLSLSSFLFAFPLFSLFIGFFFTSFFFSLFTPLVLSPTPF